MNGSKKKYICLVSSMTLTGDAMTAWSRD